MSIVLDFIAKKKKRKTLLASRQLDEVDRKGLGNWKMAADVQFYDYYIIYYNFLILQSLFKIGAMCYAFSW